MQRYDPLEAPDPEEWQHTRPMFGVSVKAGVQDHGRAVLRKRLYRGHARLAKYTIRAVDKSQDDRRR
jgi:hypothetical protein